LRGSFRLIPDRSSLINKATGNNILRHLVHALFYAVIVLVEVTEIERVLFLAQMQKGA
jgi:hypothetical protein